MSNHHFCFSGSLSCSGCNPCEACAEHVRRLVLPVAMISGGFNQSREQAGAFFQGYNHGWQRFLDAMMRDPNLSSRLQVTDLTPLLRQAQTVAPEAPFQGSAQGHALPQSFEYPMRPQPPNLGYAAPDVQQPFPPQYPQTPSHPGMFPHPQVSPPMRHVPPMVPHMAPPMPPQTVPQRQPEPQPTLNGAEFAPRPPSPPEAVRSEIEARRDGEERGRVRGLTTALAADEIAIAASPVTEEEVSSSKVTLGSVMGPGFIPRDKRGAPPPISGENSEPMQEGESQDTNSTGH